MSITILKIVQGYSADLTLKKELSRYKNVSEN
jgi:hypothetical protein